MDAVGVVFVKMVGDRSGSIVYLDASDDVVAVCGLPVFSGVEKFRLQEAGLEGEFERRVFPLPSRQPFADDEYRSCGGAFFFGERLLAKKRLVAVGSDVGVFAKPVDELVELAMLFKMGADAVADDLGGVKGDDPGGVWVVADEVPCPVSDLLKGPLVQPVGAAALAEPISELRTFSGGVVCGGAYPAR